MPAGLSPLDAVRAAARRYRDDAANLREASKNPALSQFLVTDHLSAAEEDDAMAEALSVAVDMLESR